MIWVILLSINKININNLLYIWSSTGGMWYFKKSDKGNLCHQTTSKPTSGGCKGDHQGCSKSQWTW